MNRADALYCLLKPGRVVTVQVGSNKGRVGYVHELVTTCGDKLITGRCVYGIRFYGDGHPSTWDYCRSEFAAHSGQYAAAKRAAAGGDWHDEVLRAYSEVR